MPALESFRVRLYQVIIYYLFLITMNYLFMMFFIYVVVSTA